MIRTLKFIDWHKFLEEKNEKPELILDFEIDAGFSFTHGVVLRKMQKTGSTVLLDGSLHVPSKLLKFKDLSLSQVITLHSIRIESLNFQKIETTERYKLSVKFSPCGIDFEAINTEIKQLIIKSENCSEENVIISYMVDYFQNLASIVKNDVISFIELSNSFTQFVNGSYNLYIINNNDYYRAFQRTDAKETAWNNPIHPLTLKANEIHKRHEMLSNLPKNIKTYLSKGSHYKFLGFYDESYISYYKIVETIFKGDIFPYILAQSLFESNDKKLITTIKSSNQKTMMLFIYQWLVLNENFEDGFQKNEIINKLLSASELRNGISHSVDQSEESKKQLPFIIMLSHALIKSVTTKR